MSYGVPSGEPNSVVGSLAEVPANTAISTVGGEAGSVGLSRHAGDLEAGYRRPPGAGVWDAEDELDGAVRSASPLVSDGGTCLPAPLYLTVHGVEGLLRTAMVAPFVRVHILDANTGVYHLKRHAAQHSVYNLDSGGVPYLRKTPRPEPWQADFSRSKYILPFATAPCPVRRERSGVQGAPPVWNESFLLVEPLPRNSLLMVEILDAVSARHLEGTDSSSGNMPQCLNVGWAFLDLGSETAMPKARRHRRRRLKLQLHRYQFQPKPDRSRGIWFWRQRDGPQVEANEGDRQPDVFAEYQRASELPNHISRGVDTPWVSLMAHAAIARVHAWVRRRERQRWPAALEVSLEPGNAGSASRVAEAAAAAAAAAAAVATGAGELSGAVVSASSQESLTFPGEASKASRETGASSAPEGVGLSSGGEDSGMDVQSALAKPQHSREAGEACALPSGLLWQIVAGKRGAVRLSLSPSGQMLAAAVGRQGGSCELRVFALSSGRLHAVCTPAHDALVYDLCWHGFAAPRGGWEGTSPPLLISCGGDALVQMFEVPEGVRALPSKHLRPHARIQLWSHVYSVRPHPILSSDPEKLVLACGGNGFGLALCRVIRVWHQDGHEGTGRWQALHPPWNEAVDCKALAVRRSTQVGRHELQSREESVGEVPDILCVRFSTQSTSPDNLYACDVAGRVLMFQVRLDPSLEVGRGGVRADFVRMYTAPVFAGTPIYSMEVVTQQLLEGKRLNHVLLSTVDDWLLLHSRDHTIRLVTLQRGVVRTEVEMHGHESATFPVRGVMSPDGAYVASGSETGELLLWNAYDGKIVTATSSLPRVQLSGPVMDVVWSHHHHLMACCAVDDQAPPILVFVGGDPNRARSRKVPAARDRELPLSFVSFRDAPKEERTVVHRSSVAPPAAAFEWAANWLNAGETNPRSAVGMDEKRRMKEDILAQLVEKRAVEDLDRSLVSVPGGLSV